MSTINRFFELVEANRQREERRIQEKTKRRGRILAAIGAALAFGTVVNKK